MTYNQRKTQKVGNSKGWFRHLMGNVLMSIAGGLALFFVVCLFADNFPWWASIIGLVVCGILAYIGSGMRTRTVQVDPETGQVKKNNL